MVLDVDEKSRKQLTMRKYLVRGTPTVAVIGPDGTVRFSASPRKLGTTTTAQVVHLKRIIADVLQERSVQKGVPDSR